MGDQRAVQLVIRQASMPMRDALEVAADGHLHISAERSLNGLLMHSKSSAYVDRLHQSSWSGRLEVLCILTMCGGNQYSLKAH